MPVELTRRKFLRLSGTVLASVALLENPVIQTLAEAARSSYDVSYFWSGDIGPVLDYRDEVSRCLGPDVTKKLHVVRGRRNYGLIYDRNGDRASTIKVAKQQTRILKESGLEGAVHIRDDGYEALYNISYGLGPNFKALKEQFGVIRKKLGEGVAEELVIEEADNNNFALVYRRRGDLKSTKKAAKRHARKLGFKTSYRRVANHPVVLNDANYISGAPLHEEVAKAQLVKSPISSDLEDKIEKYIKRQRRQGRIASNEKTAWSVKDYTTGQTLVSINEDVPMQTASMHKPLIALAFFHQVKYHGMIYGPKSKRNMQAMIHKSSNVAANWVMKQVGGPRKVQQLLQKHYRGLFKQTSIAQYIPKGGKSYRNKASAGDYRRFLKALWENKLPHSKEIHRLMALPGSDRLVTETQGIPRRTRVYNKTGSTAMLCGDMGIINARGKNGKRYAYSLIGIIQREIRTRKYPTWIAARGNVIRGVSSIVYKEMKKRHNLR